MARPPATVRWADGGHNEQVRVFWPRTSIQRPNFPSGEQTFFEIVLITVVDDYLRVNCWIKRCMMRSTCRKNASGVISRSMARARATAMHCE